MSGSLRAIRESPLQLSDSKNQAFSKPSFERGWHAAGMTGVWPAVLRQHKGIRQNGVAKPQSPFGCQLLSKGALDAYFPWEGKAPLPLPLGELSALCRLRGHNKKAPG